MKKILCACLMLLLVSTSVMSDHVINSKENENLQFLYVLSAQSGSFEGDTLTLKDIPLVIYFSDRPNRIAGHMNLDQFLKSWTNGLGSFKADPPNAALSIIGKNRDTNIVVEILSIEPKGNSMICKVRILAGEIPSSFDKTSLFIDPINQNGQWTGT